MFCSSSLFETMDNYEAGDLTDIVRQPTSAATAASTTGGGISSDFSLHPCPAADDPLWPHLPADQYSMNFGDPFLFPTSTAQDPFLHPHFSPFNFPSDGGGGWGLEAAERPCNMFSRMLQISPSSELGDDVISSAPCESSPAVANSPPTSTLTKASACGGGAVNPLGLMEMENSGMQISSPRNPAIKRRKSQVKKVVCIPAPAPSANSRSSSGEVVPSDLWAWRKYGQKPIKGSPYPRGYYRCSSSKGCSARKQVERSRTNPNMLVITYTSEHNHSWPTQRNALAGSTRSHPSRTTATATATATTRKLERNNGNLATTAVKEEEVDEDLTTEKTAATTANEPQEEGNHQEFPYDLIFAEFADQMNDHHHHHPPTNPLNDNLLLFSSHGFTTGNDHERSKDPFLELYDWAENSNASFFKEAKGG